MDIITLDELIFKKSNKVYREWNEDLFKLMKTKLSFRKVMGSLKESFKYKE